VDGGGAGGGTREAGGEEGGGWGCGRGLFIRDASGVLFGRLGGSVVA